ncbi:cupin domain-containing protein [Knoellia locipacati]|uniref:cupin domain-containing protein n=1 Tax=Knoellia locipacati TaxID=882824 RepID=UPI003851102C
MSPTDNGPQPNAFDIEAATKDNTAYRSVAWTGKYLQVTLMSIPAGAAIGLEVHPETDQFLRLDAGQGVCRMGPSEADLTDTEVGDGWSIQVPAGTWHDVVNTGDEPLKLYAIYAPSHHAPGKVHQTAEDAERDEEAGTDEPPEWTVQPG